ncbi:MAG: hypothetical protein IPN76_03235 [Saprospiraceae bacterium]|nr:hypothetical protein [Saprospiraceae bacterium]
MKLQTLRRHSKPLASILLLIFATTLIPTRSYAITSGPAQEEFASFSPAGSSDMVNLYTGDFNYNIPLMTVPGPNGGYPINLSYSGGTDMNDPGSWVGYGWDLNIGAINRQMRGLPDDFSGVEKVKQEMSLKKSFSVGLEIPTQPSYDEYAGFPGPPIPPATTSPWTAQLYYNNYKGLGYKLGIKGPLAGSFSAGVSYDSQEGIGVDLQLGTSQESKFAELGLGLDLATSFNSRRGLQGLTYSTQFTSANETSSSKEGAQSSGISLGSPLTFGFNGSIPEVNIPTKTTSIDFDIKYGTEVNPGFWFQVGRWGKWAGSFEWSKVKEGGVVLSPAFGYLHTHLAENNSKGLKDFNRDQLPYSKKSPTSHHPFIRMIYFR